MKDLGLLHHFLGITVERRPNGLFLHQRTYTLDILKRAVMADCKPCTTSVDLQAKLVGDSGPPVEDASQFRSITGALQYLTFTRSDIAYAVQQIYLHMHDPREPHLTAMKRILRYLQRTPDYGLLLRRSSSSDLSSPVVALWPSIVSLPTAWLRPLGCVSCSTSSRPRCLGAHLSTTIISVPCTYPPTPFSINAPSMWRLIFILSERRLPSVRSTSSMSRRHRSSSTSSRRDSPPRCLMSFGPVSTSAVAELTAGVLENCNSISYRGCRATSCVSIGPSPYGLSYGSRHQGLPP
jgi:hypothetical protein